MLENQSIRDERKRDEERAAAFNAKLESLRDAATTAASRRYEDLSQRLKDLLTQKEELQKAPLTREEVLLLAREALAAAQRECSLESFLSKHLQACMERKGVPLSPAFLKSEFLPPADHWKIFYCLASEDVLKKAAALLPSGGLSRQEREKQIQKIDSEISSLEAELVKMAKEEK